MAPRPPAWAVLVQGLAERRPVRARYHGHDRIVCPHVLGWKDDRAKVLAYQCGGDGSGGSLPSDPRACWRSMFVDEIEDAVITDGTWESADNYSPRSNGIDTLEMAV